MPGKRACMSSRGCTSRNAKCPPSATSSPTCAPLPPSPCSLTALRWGAQGGGPAPGGAGAVGGGLPGAVGGRPVAAAPQRRLAGPAAQPAAPRQSYGAERGARRPGGHVWAAGVGRPVCHAAHAADALLLINIHLPAPLRQPPAHRARGRTRARERWEGVSRQGPAAVLAV